MTQEKRRFPRVTLQNFQMTNLDTLSARMTWPNLEVSSLTDLSYKGLAARKPGLFEISAQKTFYIELNLGLQPKFSVLVRVAWMNLELVGMEFTSLPAAGHQAMTEYLDILMRGYQLREVQAPLSDGTQGSQTWLQGPDGTHVFLHYNDGKKLEKVHVDLVGSTVEFSKQQKFNSDDLLSRKALLVLSQIDKPELIDFIRTLTSGS